MNRTFALKCVVFVRLNSSHVNECGTIGGRQGCFLSARHYKRACARHHCEPIIHPGLRGNPIWTDWPFPAVSQLSTGPPYIPHLVC